MTPWPELCALQATLPFIVSIVVCSPHPRCQSISHHVRNVLERLHPNTTTAQSATARISTLQEKDQVEKMAQSPFSSTLEKSKREGIRCLPLFVCTLQEVWSQLT
jgi:hypothetical protein